MSQQLAPWSTPTETDTSTIETDTSTATMLPTGPDTQGPQVLTSDDMLSPHYVLALKSVGADADKPKDPHDTLNWLGLNTDELARYEDFRGLGVWGGKSRHGTACLLVAHPGQGFREGIGDEACSPEGLKTIAELTYGGAAYSTGEDFTGLPPGSLIRFVLNGDHVDVHLYVRAADPIASQG